MHGREAPRDVSSHSCNKTCNVSEEVELHVHLDGCARYETLYELATKKNLYIPGSGTFEDLKKNCIIREPESLAAFLKPYKFYNPYYAGDLEAIERLAYEFCEDSKRCNVIYSEVRYSPHKLVGFASCDKYGLQEEAPNNPDLISFFAEAKRRGYGTTIHAGEVSGPAGIKRNLNAARSCFLPEDEKKDLIKRLMEAYG
ncbi:unnamed protein product [Bemisia tabaci]|uniref:adenosine deaminase n=1 Tax=Bemisia tabaci TaxID=7038 RepID=A0A9P0AJ38_BEMTA|nr:unnamed protein product [Bemisia tabaci]